MKFAITDYIFGIEGNYKKAVGWDRIFTDLYT